MTTGVYLPGARGKRRGFSPAAAARPLDRTRVMRIVARGECLPNFCLKILGPHVDLPDGAWPLWHLAAARPLIRRTELLLCRTHRTISLLF